MSLKRERAQSPPQSLDIFLSQTIEDQKSVFIAAFSQSKPVKALQAIPEFASATHRIAAWRKRSKQRSIMGDAKVLYDLGHDDDGEKWAGTRLQRVLQDQDIEGVVVVARWYGGQNIGPVRFTHIESTAKQAIWEFKQADQTAQRESSLKRQKLEEDKKRSDLEKDLRERDANILALRGLLAKKKAELDDSDIVPPTPQKPVDYSTMSMELLIRQDKARDKTIAFVLEQINKVEEQLNMVQAIEESTHDDWQNEEEKQATPDGPSTPK